MNGTDTPEASAFPRHRLGRRIVVLILLFGLFATFLATLTHVYLEYRHQLSMEKARLQEIATNHLPALRQDIWLTRFDAVALHIEGLVHLPGVRYVRVRLHDHEEIVRGDASAGEVDVHRFPLHAAFDGRSVDLGTLEVAISREEIFLQLRHQAAHILLAQAVQIFLTGFFILYLLHVLVGRRLRFMASYAHHIQLKHLTHLEPLPLRPGSTTVLDELDHLAMALNQMVSELRVSYLQLHAATQTIQKERDRATQYLDLVGGIIVEIDREERVTLINRAGCELLGHQEEQEILGRNWFDDFLPDDNRAAMRAVFHQYLDGLSPPSLPSIFENAIRRKDGSQRHILWHNRLLFDKTPRSLSHGIDITERREAEQRLLDTQRLFDAIIDNSQAIIFIKSPDGRFLLVNRRCEQLLNLSNEQLRGRKDTDVFPPDVAQHLRANDQDTLALGRVEREERIPLPDGSHRDYLALKFALKDEDGNPFAVCGIATDITELKRIQANLQWESAINLALQRLSRLLIATDYRIIDVARELLAIAGELTASPYGYVAEIDPDYRIIASLGGTMPNCGVSHGQPLLSLARGFFSNDPATDIPLTLDLPPGHIPMRCLLCVPVLLDSRAVGQIVLINAPSGYGERDVDALTRLGNLFALAIRQKRALEEKSRIELQLSHAQKLEAIGTLAAGIAHDFNNILAIIMGNAEFGMVSHREDPALMELLGDMMQASTRGRDLVRQLLNFSRRDVGEFHYFEPRAVLKETLRLLRSTIPATVEITSVIDPHAHAIFGDPVGFQQVVMNLCTNALHAMNGRPAPRMEVRIEPEHLDMTRAVQLNVAAGEYACLTVSDNGCGIPEEIRARIFDPFFTTKASGVGTGLGLAMVQTYAHDARGGVEVQSTPDGGTLFRVYFPMARTMTGEMTQSESRREARTGRGRVLLIDDEPQVVKVTARMLELIGFEVEAQEDPELALQRLAREPAVYVALLTDRSMPAMSGEEVGRRAHALRGDLPVFLCSGFIDAAMLNQERLAWLTGTLKKPFSISELEKALAGVAPRAG
ncbi:MAG: PAS domain S-box protein [Magnetococcales bacterium]|nr:PAS domain S-box protein [Magnetococcales bacterium]